MDGVRALHFVESIDTLISASEDCTLKLWSIRALEEENDGNFEPYVSLRGHTGRILAMAGGMGRRIFTGSSEGVLKAWEVPDRSEVNPYGDTYDGKSYCIQTISDSSQEPIWDLKLNPMTELLLQASANNYVNVWNAGATEFPS